ncbi:MAG: RICIN domain-containing protein [Syntrophobacterales bacterium]|nr:RICIN domain-containing protein [Syntrophobacterales bacterium]
MIHSGTCLDVAGGGTANGTVVHIWQCQAGNRNQDWTFDNGRIVWTGTNKCLDVNAGGTANGTKVQSWDCQNGNTNQRWSLDTNFPGKIVWTGTNKCLDVNAGGTANGTKVQTWDCMAGNGNQQWTIGELNLNPPANSVKAVHGNTDWNIDTANAFLFGKNMAGSQTTQHYAPNTWSKTHSHIGLTNTSKYYYDKSRVSTGADTDVLNGIDQTMLFFYTGHGNPTIWNTLGDNATQSSVLLANSNGGGKLRYYWQCSCAVFAHGPETCTPRGTFSYSCPNKFNGAADSVSMRNVFQRWGSALNSSLRMACGGSTSMYCNTDQVDRVWSNYARGYTVAQMFLDGFGQGGAYGVVPLCITMGGDDITKTPLYDTSFTNAPNTSGNTHYHLMYPAGTQQSSSNQLSARQITQQLPKFKVAQATPPPKLVKALSTSGTSLEVASPLLAGGKARLERVSGTGALHLDSGQIAKPGRKTLTEKEYIKHAASFLSEQEWSEQQTAEPMVTRYTTVSMPVAGQPSEMQETQAGVTVQYKRVVQAGGASLEVLGTAGTIRVQMDNEGTVLRATKLWQKLEPISSSFAVKDFEAARAEAMKQLHAADSYQLNQWKLGYRQVSVGADQDELRPVYQFAFVPAKQHDIEHPPQLIEVSALKQ